MFRSFVSLIPLIALAVPAVAQITSPAEFLGYELGENFTRHHQIVDYLETLAEESERFRIAEYGETWEGRPLNLLTISTAANMSGLDRIRALHRAAISPEGPAVEGAPVVVWLAFGVHGNESSSAEAAMKVAHWLAEEAPESLLERMIVLIDPLENPDGRERYVNWFRRVLGMRPNPAPWALEHQEPWPGGRYNHYLFDMNRDWAWATQPETRARIEVYKEWMPQVVVDLHEMYWNSSYFFPPATDPINKNIHPQIEEMLELFGRANAETFSEQGWPFYVGENFDLFYPGYGDSWPSLRGSVGMTYEVGGHGRAGLVIEDEDGRGVTLASRVTRHAAAAISTLRTAAANRERLLEFTRASRARFLDDETSYLLLDTSPWFDEAVELLELQGIEVRILDRPFRARAEQIAEDRTFNREFPAGTAVIPVGQPLGGLVKTLFEREPVLDQEFLEEQRELVESDESTDFFDITGWSIPLAFNLEGWVTRARIPGESLRDPDSTPAAEFSEARYGWAVPGDDDEVWRTAAALLRERIRFGVAGKPLDTGDKGVLPPGSLIVLRGENGDRVPSLLRSISTATGARFIPYDRGWEGATPLGSTTVRPVLDPRILLVGGAPTSPTSFGALWHTLDVVFEIPHTVVEAEALDWVDLDEHRVIILPAGWGWRRVLNENLLRKLADWVRRGGTLVAVGNASEALRSGEAAISEIEQRPQAGEDDDENTEPTRYTSISVPGAIMRTSMANKAPYTLGVRSSPPVLIAGSVALDPHSKRAANIVTIDEEDPVIAGVVWAESEERVRGSAWMIAERSGRGEVVTFASDPHFRGFWKGTLPLFLNTVLYGPSF